jgi:hypothetical protein
MKKVEAEFVDVQYHFEFLLHNSTASDWRHLPEKVMSLYFINLT